MGYNTTFNTTPQPQKTLGGLLSPLSNMNQQIKSSPILNPTGQSSQPIPVPASASKPMNPATSSVMPGILNPHPTAPTTNPVASHTTTTNPDGTTTTKQTYDTTTGFLTPEGIAEGKPAVQPGDPNAPQAPVSKTAPGTNANNGTNFQQNLGNVANSGNQTGNENTTFSGLVNSANEANDPNSRISQAYQKAQDLTNNYVTQENAIQGTPIPLEFQQGRGQILANQYGTQEAAAQTGISNALAGQGQQITGLTAANTAAQNTAQRATGANENVAGLTAPQPYGLTTTPYAPGTNQYGTLAANSAGTNGLQNAGNVQGQIGVGQNVAQLNSYLGGANVVGNNLNQLIQDNNINPVGLTYANGALQFGASQLSNPAYQKFAGQINDFVASLAPILGVGGSSTDMKTQMSSQIVNALQGGSTIQDVVSYFLDQAQQKIKGLSAGGGSPVGSASPGAGTPQNNAPISSSVVSGNYTLENGKWVYNAK